MMLLYFPKYNKRNCVLWKTNYNYCSFPCFLLFCTDKNVKGQASQLEQLLLPGRLCYLFRLPSTYIMSRDSSVGSEGFHSRQESKIWS